MAKKKKIQMEAWCWYCDREFEDDKVLLQHQKAKHYKCPQCPRRLNTAGGLTVHLHQVHKSEPTKIENALPGRESFDIEIYGMVGIPEADLAAWRAKKEAEGQGSSGSQHSSKRQKIENVALTPEQLKAQLEAHKALMSGQSLPPGSVPPPGFPGFSPPPPAATPSSSAAPGGFPAYSGPPPGFPSVPPPGYGRPPPPGMPAYNGPPPGQPWQQPPPQQPQYTGPPPPNITVPTPSPHQKAVREGAKSRMVYSDPNFSPEEKMASSSKYAYVDPDDAPSQQQQTQYQQQQPYYGGPPPAGPPPAMGYGGAASSYGYARPPPLPVGGYAGSPNAYASPYGAGAGSSSPAIPPPHGSFAGSPPPPPSHQQPYLAPSNGAGFVAASSASPYSQPQAQSYPAIPPGASPPASRPEANTAEALAATNASAAQADAAGGGKREQDVAAMEKKAAAQGERPGQGEEEVPVKEVGPGGDAAEQQSSSQGKGSSTGTPGRRTRAADLF